MKLFIIIFILSVSLFPNPWGKDAELNVHNSYPKNANNSYPNKQNLLQIISATIINFHQTIISPADGPRSNFYPSSSQYALDAINKYGFLKGYLLGCDRLIRENSDPWYYPTIKINNVIMKYDPVR